MTTHDYQTRMELRQCGWDDELIEKYIDYRRKKEFVKEWGRVALKDSEKSKVYKAEWKFQQDYKDQIKKFKNFDQAVKYVNRVQKSKLWNQLTDKKVVTHQMSDRVKRFAGVAYGSSIHLSNLGLDQYTVLHELAHCTGGNMHHGLSFRQTLIKLVSRFIGRDAAAALTANFRANNLKMSNVKVKTPDQWLVAYQKMQKVRGNV